MRSLPLFRTGPPRSSADSSSVAPGSCAAYLSAVKRYLKFAAFSFPSLPITETKILRFIAYPNCQSLAAVTVSAYLSGITARIVAAGLPDPELWTPRVQLAERAMARAQPPPAHPKPITFQLLHSMISSLVPSMDNLVIAYALPLTFSLAPGPQKFVQSRA